MNDVLQKLVDTRLKTFTPESDYIRDSYYDYSENDIFSDLKSAKVSNEQFAAAKLNKKVIKNAVTKSVELTRLLERYKKSIIDGLANPIYEQLLESREDVKCQIEDDKIEEEDRIEQKRYDLLRASAICN
jgi:hypothetical protein